MKPANPLVLLALHFATLSLIAVGGGNTVIPAMHRQAVEIGGWMTDRQFAEMFAIAQAAPGPNILIVTLIGWKLAGIAGGLVATGAMCGPSCLLTYAFTRTWDRFRHARWRAAIQGGLAPVTVGLVLASGFILGRAADRTWVDGAITAATVAFVLRTRLNPLWLLAAGALLGLFGLT